MISLFKVFMADEVMSSLSKVIYSGYIGQGSKVDEFEACLGKSFNSNNILATNSGTAAIQLALKICNIGYGDEVLSTPVTCLATNAAIMAQGGVIKWYDVDPYTGCASWKDIAKQISKKTKAIVVVHFGGYPCDMDEIRGVATAYNIPVIEDGAHTYKAIYKETLVGNSGYLIALSFQAIKFLTTVDGGALFCRSREDYERGKLLRWFGIDRENYTSRKDLRCEADVAEVGYKMHMNDIVATIGLGNIKYVDGLVAKTFDNAQYYNTNLAGINGLSLPAYQDDRVSSYWLYPIFVKNRDRFVEKMKEHDIMCSKVHARNDTHSALWYCLSDLPGVDDFYSKFCCIPVGWWITNKEREYIVDSIKKILKYL